MLAVDIGNTTTRLAAFTDASVGAQFSWPTRRLDSAAVAEAIRSTGAARRLWISSVAPYAEQAIVTAAEETGLICRFIRPVSDHIIANTLTTLHTTGADRLLSAMAAGELYKNRIAGRGYCVIQCGSAATVDFVDKNSVFAGGFILPGPAMWLSGLAGAAQLPDLSGAAPDWSDVRPGNNTKDAMMRGMAIALPQAVAQTALQTGCTEQPIFVTGGWGGVVAATIGEQTCYEPDLLLHGIRMFAERNGDA